MSVFERESRVTEDKQRPGWSAFDCVRPQVRWIKESYFEGPNAKWPDDAFDIFIQESWVSGYILGLIEVGLLPDARLSEADIVDVVILASVHFEANGFPAQIADSYVWQSPSFRFGLCLGLTEAAHHIEQKRLTGFPDEFSLLARLFCLLLEHDNEQGGAESLKISLRFFCDTHGLEEQDEDTLENIAEHWVDLTEELREMYEDE